MPSAKEMIIMRVSRHVGTKTRNYKQMKTDSKLDEKCNLGCYEIEV